MKVWLVEWRCEDSTGFNVIRAFDYQELIIECADMSLGAKNDWLELVEVTVLID